MIIRKHDTSFRQDARKDRGERIRDVRDGEVGTKRVDIGLGRTSLEFLVVTIFGRNRNFDGVRTSNGVRQGRDNNLSTNIISFGVDFGERGLVGGDRVLIKLAERDMILLGNDIKGSSSHLFDHVESISVRFGTWLTSNQNFHILDGVSVLVGYSSIHVKPNNFEGVVNYNTPVSHLNLKRSGLELKESCLVSERGDKEEAASWDVGENSSSTIIGSRFGERLSSIFDGRGRRIRRVVVEGKFNSRDRVSSS
mmetsp:Transcript_34881/g.54355  ORF Transcript_34881/g.54355 Transcript_34881/m.54355 type:complete len:252 (+) Transcript_34881:2247-3002(+)